MTQGAMTKEAILAELVANARARAEVATGPKPPSRAELEAEKKANQRQCREEKLWRINADLVPWRRQQAIDAVWEKTLAEREAALGRPDLDPLVWPQGRRG